MYVYVHSNLTTKEKERFVRGRQLPFCLTHPGCSSGGFHATWRPRPPTHKHEAIKWPRRIRIFPSFPRSLSLSPLPIPTEKGIRGVCRMKGSSHLSPPLNSPTSAKLLDPNLLRMVHDPLPPRLVTITLTQLINTIVCFWGNGRHMYIAPNLM